MYLTVEKKNLQQIIIRTDVNVWLKVWYTTIKMYKNLPLKIHFTYFCRESRLWILHIFCAILM